MPRPPAAAPCSESQRSRHPSGHSRLGAALSDAGSVSSSGSFQSAASQHSEQSNHSMHSLHSQHSYHSIQTALHSQQQSQQMQSRPTSQQQCSGWRVGHSAPSPPLLVVIVTCNSVSIAVHSCVNNASHHQQHHHSRQPTTYQLPTAVQQVGSPSNSSQPISNPPQFEHRLPK